MQGDVKLNVSANAIVIITIIMILDYDSHTNVVVET